MSNTNTKLFLHGKYLAELIACSIRESAPERPFDGIDWEQIYQLAVFHNVTALVYPSLKALDVPAEIMQKFTYHNNRMIAREARQEIDAQKIFSVLKKENIPFIKMKGIALKNCYPLPYMRSHSDVDICMSAENRKRAGKILEDMGYIREGSIDYHDEYCKDDFFIYEIHSAIMSPRSPLAPVFEEPFSKAVPDSDSAGYVFNDDYFYLSLVIHLYKHFVSEGCGIRLFADLLVFERTHPKLDFNFVRKTLEKYGLCDFYEHIRNLCSCLFGGQEFDERYTLIAEFIFKSGEYGSPELKRISWISSDKSANISFRDKMKYFFKNWFPGVSILKKKYPVLEKAPVLLPVCWIRRGFYTIFHKPQALKEQRAEIKKMSSQEMKHAKHIRSLAGIR